MAGGPDQKPGAVWFILGPSGVGKSSFGEWLAAEQNWMHFEIDRYPDGDGIDLNNLRFEWNEFYGNMDATQLSQAVHLRLQGEKACGVLTFPGNLLLSPSHIASAAQAGIGTIYLYGSAAHCITAFLAREKRRGRNLGLAHWSANNRDLYMRISEPDFAQYRIHVFEHTGNRRPHREVFDSMLKADHG